MCDYSLMAFPNRLAREGEELLVHRFSSGSLGLASPDELHKTSEPTIARRRSWWKVFQEWFTASHTSCVTAVCIPPSARLRLHDISEDFQAKYALQSEEEVIFQQLSAEVNTYRDALRFRNGCNARLQELREGQRVTVLDLGNADTLTPGGAGVHAALERV